MLFFGYIRRDEFRLQLVDLDEGTQPPHSLVFTGDDRAQLQQAEGAGAEPKQGTERSRLVTGRLSPAKVIMALLGECAMDESRAGVPTLHPHGSSVANGGGPGRRTPPPPV